MYGQRLHLQFVNERRVKQCGECKMRSCRYSNGNGFANCVQQKYQTFRIERLFSVRTRVSVRLTRRIDRFRRSGRCVVWIGFDQRAWRAAETRWDKRIRIRMRRRRSRISLPISLSPIYFSQTTWWFSATENLLFMHLHYNSKFMNFSSILNVSLRKRRIISHRYRAVRTQKLQTISLLRFRDFPKFNEFNTNLTFNPLKHYSAVFEFECAHLASTRENMCPPFIITRRFHYITQFK